MKKNIIILLLMLISPVVNAKPNYEYIKNDAENVDYTSIVEKQETQKQSKIKVSGGFRSNRGYATIKLNNGRNLHINTPKISNNSVLKLINIGF